MKKKCPEMRYLVVPEQHKSGRWHFHGLFAKVDALEFTDSGRVDNFGRIIYNVDNYRLGFSTATQITDVDKASSYMCKYITKNLCDVTKGKKRYWASRNLDEPMVYEFISKSRKVLEYCMSQEEVYAKTVRSEYADVHYIEIPIYKTNPYLSNRCVPFFIFYMKRQDYKMSNDSNNTYQKQVYIDNTIKLRGVLNTLPEFARDYFRSIEPTSSPRTRISYAYDIRVFFQFLLETNPKFKEFQMTDFRITDLEDLTPLDIEEYQEYLKVYQASNHRLVTNTEKGLSRKMSSLRSFYAYYYKRELIHNNPTLLVNMPKLHEKAIIRMDSDEVARLLDYVENCGETLSGQAKLYYEKTKDRDIAILTLLLGTGIRVSECVGLDLTDIDFNNNSITVTRKGGNQSVVYFGDEVETSLKNYLENSRALITPQPGYENALFLSTQKRRMGVQAIENMVKKYASQVTSKKITPHKLRSTYGTALYRETSDIYLVADVLGHKDVNTTKKHYAASDEDRKRKAANVVKLREP